MLSHVSHFVHRCRGDKQGKLGTPFIDDLDSLCRILYEGDLLILYAEKPFQEAAVCYVNAEPPQALRRGFVCKERSLLGEHVKVCFIVLAAKAKGRVRT
jgi:hypothetical protein